MEWFNIWSGSCICLVVVFLVLYKIYNKSRGRRPPGPPGWPLIGNIFDLLGENGNAHQKLATLSQKYGPIMWLQMGVKNTVVISSAQVAMEFFKKHDLAASDRSINESCKVHNFDQFSVGIVPFGEYWRMMRRLYTTQLFTNTRLKATENLRSRIIDNMLKLVWKNAQEKGGVELAGFIQVMAFNSVGNVIFSKDITDQEKNDGTSYFNASKKFIDLIIKPNVADYFPWLRWFDPQGIKRQMIQTMGHTLSFSRALINERIQDRKNDKSNKNKDFLDVLLDFQSNQADEEPAKLTESSISVSVQDLLTGATETTSTTVEWTITELLRHSRVMRNVEVELDRVVGQGKKVEEGDITNLPYLQAVIKETLRLHPPGPLLLPRSTREDIEFMGYSIPKNTQIIVNVWAIGRDPTSWEDPISFIPERFLNSDVDYKGQHFQFLPFGVGRRICVGLPLAYRMTNIIIASLVHTFELSPADGIEPEEISVKEYFASALRKAVPLKAVVKLRGVPQSILPK